MDNIIIAQSSDLYDQMSRTLEDNNRQIESMGKELTRITNMNLKHSILYEGAKRQAENLKEENRRLTTCVDRLKEIAFMHCEMFEQIYGSDELSFNYDKMREYLDVAELMERQYGRKTPYINRVRDRISRMRIR